MRSTKSWPWGRLVLIAVLLGGVGNGAAQPAQGQGQEAGSGERIAEEELADYVRAARAVYTIRKGETEPVAPAVRRRMVEAVEEQGLTLERYNNITRRLRQDEDLYARYQKAWEE